MKARRKAAASVATPIPPAPAGTWELVHEPEFWDEVAPTHTVKLTDRATVERMLEILDAPGHDKEPGRDAFRAKLADVLARLTDGNADLIRSVMEMMQQAYQPAISRALGATWGPIIKGTNNGVKSGEARRAKAEKLAAAPTVEKIVAVAWKSWSKRTEDPTATDFVDHAVGGLEVVEFRRRWSVAIERDNQQVRITVKCLSGTSVRLPPRSVTLKTLRNWCKK